MQAENIAVNNPHIALPFTAINIAQSAPLSSMWAVNGSAEFWPAPADGYVVGLAVAVNDFIGTGSVTMGINHSTPDNMSALESTAVVSAGEFSTAEQFPIGMYPFSAGDRLGVTYTPTGLDAATFDLTAVLLVVLTGVRV